MQDPEIVYTFDLTENGKLQFKTSRDFVFGDIQYDKQKGVVYEKFADADPSFSPGCSWYCGGGPEAILSSSSLKTNGTLTYVAKNIHDFNLDTAWVEGSDDYGIGEYVEYIFAKNSARPTTLYIINGYIKSQKAWTENSRVKELILKLNNKTLGVIHLKDVAAVQKVKLPLYYESKEHPGYSLKFIIKDVYPGTKFKDTAITEITLDGIDVHCVDAKTKILMSDNRLKYISEIKVGDRIIVLRYSDKKQIITKVKKIITTKHDVVYNYGNVKITSDHVFLNDNYLKTNAEEMKCNKIYEKDKIMYNLVVDESHEVFFKGNNVWLKAEN